MSDSQINVTPGSGGPNIDLQILDNTNARQVICVGDPAAVAKVAPVDATLGLSVNPTALPPGAATAANQTSSASTLSTIAANQTNGSEKTQLVNGANTAAIDAAGDVQVDVNNFPATQTVAGTVAATQSGAWTVSLTTESIEIGKVDQGTPAAAANSWPVEVTDGTNILGTPTHPIRVDPTGTTTQPVSAASLPLPTGAATSVNQTNGTQVTQLVDSAGVNKATVDAAGDLQVDVNNFPATQTVAGTVTSNQGTAAAVTSAWPVEIAGGSGGAGGTNILRVDAGGNTVTKIVDAGGTTFASVTGNNALKVDLSGTAANGTAIKVDGSTVTQPVSGTVTANIGTSGSLALDASVTGLQVGQGSTTSGQKGELQQGAVTTSAPTYVTGQTSPMSLTTAGALRTDASATTQPVSGTITTTPPANASTNITQVGGAALTEGQKAMAASVPVVLASDQSVINVAPATPNIATYTATITALATAALATDIFTVTGSATKLVKIRRFTISGSQTTAGSVRFVSLKRSTADTAGTSTNPTATPHDSNNAAATATINAYTANPTTGTLVGNLIAKSVIIEIAAATTDFQGWDFTQDEAVQPVTLRGITQVFALNLGGVTVAGSSLNISVTWTEE